MHTYIFSESINTRRRTEYTSNRYVNLAYILKLIYYYKYSIYYK